MNRLLTLVVVIAIVSCNSQNETGMKNGMEPPVAEKKDSILNVHGDSRVDPYFWMRLTDEQKMAEEKDEQTQKVINYLEAENEYKSKVMAHTEGLQDKLYDEIVGRIKKDDSSVPYFKNGYWYYTRYEEGGEYPIYCRKKDNLENEEEVIINVNELAEGHDYFSLGGLTVSPDNNTVAFGVDTISRRQYVIHFKDLTTGEIHPDRIHNTSGGGAWADDNQTFFYTSKNDVTLLTEKIWRHTLGDDQSEDELVYEEEDNTYYIGVYRSKSDNYIIIYAGSTLVSDYWTLKSDNPAGDFTQFTPRGSKHEYNIEHFEDKWYIVSNWDAENFRLMETSENSTEMDNWKEVIPHREDVLLNGIDVFSNYLVVDERYNALDRLKVIDQSSGEEHFISFDEPAYLLSSVTNPEFETEELRFRYSSLTTPSTTYNYNMKTRERVVLKQQEVVGGHNPEDYITERIWVEARDGVKVPMSIVYKKGFEKNGQNPFLLYAYGSYGSTTYPRFNSSMLSLLDRGFAYGIAHIRGGQEMGRKWYEDGKMFRKKNTFNDFVDCSKYLIENNWTSEDHLYARGGSAGGLLMGAIVNMNPELYNGVVAAVPFVDVISTMLDESIPLTTGEFDEWGNPKNFESYEYMLSYSPYDQVSAQEYPNMLVTTGFFDSQVQYWEPAKWVAKLRDMKTGDKILLLDTDMESGHGGASGRFKRYRRTALEYAFMLDLEGIEK